MNKRNTQSKSTKTNIVPLGDRVLIRPLSEEELGTTSASGIIIPETVSQEKPERGTVVAVGEGRFNEEGDERVPMTLKAGDTVIFSKYGFDEVEVDGVEYIIIREENVLAVIER